MAKSKVQSASHLAEWWQSKVRRSKMKRMRYEFTADGVGVSSRNLTFLTEPELRRRLGRAFKLGGENFMTAKSPTSLARSAVASRGPSNALRLEGELGANVRGHTGLLAVTVCEALRFATVPRTYWLFNTWSGGPTERLCGEEAPSRRRTKCRHIQQGCLRVGETHLAPYPNVKMVRGILPDSL